MKQNPFESKNKPPIYDAEGKVIDIEIAREGAEAENKYHKKTLGIFGPSAKKIRRGEINAELAMEKAVEIDSDALPSLVATELEKYRDEMEEKHQLDFDIYEIFKSDIGDGITRYRIFGDVQDDLWDIASGAPGLSSQDVEITIDVRDGRVVKSEGNFNPDDF